jgi:hypothetical protein
LSIFVPKSFGLIVGWYGEPVALGLGERGAGELEAEDRALVEDLVVWEAVVPFPLLHPKRTETDATRATITGVFFFIASPDEPRSAERCDGEGR